MSRSDSRSPAIVLVADDNDAHRQRLARSLRGQGCGVLEAKTSIEALLMAAAFAGDIDTLITSVELRTYSNGPELAHCLRVSRPEMRVIYLCDADYPCEDAAREALLGEATLLPRPMSAGEMKALVGEVAAPRTALALKPATIARF